ncbi:hypothetical protein BDA99DRAFT_592252 [Phascolomyces articulosus]|uniref:MULE transposase domain-containing protein n=1 Tax=Phascolomyces articulosus TaxID=60185 RepID=A0AAD5P8D9_9FUNG|nr:hypothetical protein BDA99DRAFT_592252 [Phascolomyces articulosus]
MDTMLRLCLWHIQRSVSLKLKQTRSRNIPSYNVVEAQREFTFIVDDFTPSTGGCGDARLICSKPQRKQIATLIRKHYSMHPLIPYGNRTRNAFEIHQESTQEIYEYCRANQLVDAWVYLYTNCYT